MSDSGTALPTGGPPTLRTGERVGRYRVERVLGQGGMGVVYVARDEVLGRLVALKLVVPMDQGADGEKIAEASVRLLREAIAAGALQHPNVVAVYDAGEHDGAPFFAMELVEGETLRRKMQSAVPLATRLAWLGAIADGLGAAHAKGIVHRDVKPENVMVRGDGLIKILDFGVARRAAQAAAASPETVTVDANLLTITAAGVPLGTPLYMAPEQLLGKPTDGRSDQFSWGVLAHELLAGRPPWSTASGVEMVSQILGADAPPLPDDVPAPVRAAVRRALAKDPAARFLSMGDLLEAMRGAEPAVHQTAAAAVLPARPAATSPGRRRRRVAAAALACAVIAAITLLALSRRPHEAAPKAPTAITDLPPPRSDKPEALQEYRRALVELRSGSRVGAWRALEHATTLDPSMGVGWVRMLAHCRFSDLARDTFRRWFKVATQLRASLDERDRALLDAAEPMVLPDMNDDAEWERRMLPLAARYPGDAEIAYLTGEMHTARGDFDAARAELGRALRLDPGYVAAAVAQAEAAQRGGDEAALTASLAACFALAPHAMGCLRLQALYESYRGDCSAYEATARHIIAVDPDASAGYFLLHQALLTKGSRGGGLVDLQRRWTDALSPVEAPKFAPVVSFLTAWSDGDFAAAKLQATRMHDFEVGRAAQSSHSSDAFLLAIADETADRAAEAEISREVIDQKPSWIPDQTSHYLGFLAPARRLGVVTEERYRALLAAYVEEARAQLEPPVRNAVWFYAYAGPARTRAEAEEALAALPSFTPLPSDVVALDEPLGDGSLGAVYALTGAWDEAIPLLERATARCVDDLFGLGRARQRLLLGEAREAKGDARGACEAYARVLDRWSDAKPRSVTADEARKRSRALGCPGHGAEPGAAGRRAGGERVDPAR